MITIKHFFVRSALMGLLCIGINLSAITEQSSYRSSKHRKVSSRKRGNSRTIAPVIPTKEIAQKEDRNDESTQQKDPNVTALLEALKEAEENKDSSSLPEKSKLVEAGSTDKAGSTDNDPLMQLAAKKLALYKAVHKPLPFMRKPHQWLQTGKFALVHPVEAMKRAPYQSLQSIGQSLGSILDKTPWLLKAPVRFAWESAVDLAPTVAVNAVAGPVAATFLGSWNVLNRSHWLNKGFSSALDTVAPGQFEKAKWAIDHAYNYTFRQPHIDPTVYVEHVIEKDAEKEFYTDCVESDDLKGESSIQRKLYSDSFSRFMDDIKSDQSNQSLNAGMRAVISGYAANKYFKNGEKMQGIGAGLQAATSALSIFGSK